MPIINVFNFLSLDGYYKGANDDISWHVHNAEGSSLAASGLASNSILLFGRVTFTMMASFWPTAEAKKNLPEVAAGMNSAEKIVFSRTLQSTDWNNARIIKDDLIGSIKKLKETGDKNMTILGSGTIITQLAEHNLIDQYQLLIDPLAIGKGTSIFSGMKKKLELELTDTKSFKAGMVMLSYKAKTI